MPSYPEQQLLDWMAALGEAEVLNDLHLVRCSTAGVRTQPSTTTCTSLGPNDRAVLGDQLPAPANTFVMCRHLRRLIPASLIP